MAKMATTIVGANMVDESGFSWLELAAGCEAELAEGEVLVVVVGKLRRWQGSDLYSTTGTGSQY